MGTDEPGRRATPGEPVAAHHRPTQDRYLGRRLSDRQTSDVLDEMFENPTKNEPDKPESVPDENPDTGPDDVEDGKGSQ